MKRPISLLILSVLAIHFFSTDSARARPEAAKPADQPHEIVTPDVDVGSGWESESPQKTLADTLWIASWSFDASTGHCTDTGWQKVDNYIRNDGSLYWSVGAEFGGVGGINGKAATLGYSNNVCCAQISGYDNDWYQGIRLHYSGSAGPGRRALGPVPAQEDERGRRHAQPTADQARRPDAALVPVRRGRGGPALRP
jgi:hypothetical protein